LGVSTKLLYVGPG